MKADLWQYITEKLKDRDPENLPGSVASNDNDLEPSIVDIQFALGDYTHIESIKAIILATKRIDSLEQETTEVSDEVNEREALLKNSTDKEN